MSVFGWNRVTEDSKQEAGPQKPLGPFVLANKVEKPDPRCVPVRGDIAHIGLAGRYFVPHYVVPQQCMAGDTGATLHVSPSDDSEVADGLAPGERFDLLDTAGDWAWGCLSLEGPVGYVRLDELVDPSA